MPKPEGFRIRSFVKRDGRITKSQQTALDELFNIYSLPTTGKLDFKQIFKNENPTKLEIGFGNGKTLVSSSLDMPDINHIGIEVHRPGIGAVLNKIKQHNIKNLRLINTDAISVIENQIPDSSLKQVSLFFPDPWHKKRHHKRRIVSLSFLQEITRILEPDGTLHIATDWQDYAFSIIELTQDFSGLNNIADDKKFVSRPESRPETKFEKRGKKLGHDIWDIMFKKNL
jgi:tRNA (guanine-N7-)-methyltransferase